MVGRVRMDASVGGIAISAETASVAAMPGAARTHGIAGVQGSPGVADMILSGWASHSALLTTILSDGPFMPYQMNAKKTIVFALSSTTCEPLEKKAAYSRDSNSMPFCQHGMM